MLDWQQIVNSLRELSKDRKVGNHIPRVDPRSGEEHEHWKKQRPSASKRKHPCEIEENDLRSSSMCMHESEEKWLAAPF